MLSSRLETEMVLGGVFVLLWVGGRYLFGWATGHSNSLGDTWWPVVLAIAYVWLATEFRELRTRTKHMSVRLKNIVERLDRIEQQQRRPLAQ